MPIRLALAFVAGVLAWAVGPLGLLDKDVVSEIPAWILPGLIFGVLVLAPLGSRVSPGRVLAALGIGVMAWAAAFAVGGFGWMILGWLSFVAAGLVSGAILGLLVPRLIQARQYLRYFLVLCSAGLIGGIPFALCFKYMDWNDSFFAPHWVVPSYILWNLLIAAALHVCFAKEA